MYAVIMCEAIEKTRADCHSARMGAAIECDKVFLRRGPDIRRVQQLTTQNCHLGKVALGSSKFTRRELWKRDGDGCSNAD